MEETSLLSPENTFSFEAFKKEWKTADSRIKMDMIRFAGELDVEDGLEPIMLGLKEYVRPVREEAKKSLEKFAQQAALSRGGGAEFQENIIKKTGRFTAVVYGELKLTKDLKLTELFFSSLLKVGGRGPTLAWYFFSQGFVSENIMMEMIKRLPAGLQLTLLHQYALDRIWVRRQYLRLVRVLFEEINDPDAIVSFLAGLFDHDGPPDPLFANYLKGEDIHTAIRENRLKSEKLADRIEGIKAAAILGYPDCRDAMVDSLASNRPSEDRLEILKLLTQPNAPRDSDVMGMVWPLLESDEKTVAMHALSALASLRASGLGKAASGIYRNDPAMREPIHHVMDTFEWRELNSFFNALPPELSGQARSSVGQMVFEKNPDKLIQFLNYFAGSDNPFSAEAKAFLKEAESIRNHETDAICKPKTSKISALPKPKKKLFGKITQRKRKKDIQDRISRKFIKGENFQGETLSGIDLSDKQLINVDFSGATLSHVKFSSAKLDSVSFKNAYFENVNFDKAVLNAVSFENADLNIISAREATLDGCDFINCRIHGSRFDISSLQDSLFVNTKITDVHFLCADLTASSFLNAELSGVSFRFACLDLADFSLAKAAVCDYEGVDISTLTKLHGDLNVQNSRFFDLAVSSFPLEKALAETGGLKMLMLAKEIRNTHEAFLGYNSRRTELALDTFSPQQGELFELIPLLIHSDLELLPEDNPVRNAPSGISGYHPAPRAFQLLQKYFNVGRPVALHEITHVIDGLYTIGSIGTIAQSADSDIDYWICVDESKIGEKQLSLLNEKMAAMEQWADRMFDTEIHFFIVPLSEVREDRFGGSDHESSGSAQGKILKEEFYRTMILVAGRVPFWCAVPPWATDKYYKHFLKISSAFNSDLIDLGNVSAIPKGEYFGASIWQLLKSLKSPYKSVMKMALLEKYLQTDAPDGLLCNQLKAKWASGTHALRSMDPYLVLFEEVFGYYRGIDQKQAVSLLQICFFLKLGIRRVQDLEASVIPTRKEVVTDYLRRWHWDPSKVQSLGGFRDWPFEKSFLLSNRITQFMVGTYEKLSRSMRAAKDSKIAITPEDLTILGRKMFVQFSKQASKVEKLPLISHGKQLFEQLNLQYIENGNGLHQWQLVHQKKGKQKTENSNELIKQMGRIEELIIWLVRNDLVGSAASLQLMPNPTPISIQDLTEFVKAINGFFSLEEIDKLPASGLLHKAQVFKLFLVVNFCLSRRLNRIHEYAAVYVTTWGEFFCQVFTDEKGIVFVEDAIEKVKTELDYPFAGDSTGYFIPHSSRKRIKANP
jgi:adenylate cyclase, class 1